MSGPLLVTRELVVGFERCGILPPVSLELCAGQMWAVIGPNGSGKSTFLRTLVGLQPPVGGHVEVAAGVPAYVPQQGSLDAIFPIRVLEFVLMGRLAPGRFIGRRRRGEIERAQAALAEAGAQALERCLFRDLSSGQKQRVLLARAIASDARLFLLDEPTTALDRATQRAVLELIESLHRRGAAVVMVTHLVEIGLSHADRVLLLDRENETAVVGTVAEVRASVAFARLYAHFDVEANA